MSFTLPAGGGGSVQAVPLYLPHVCCYLLASQPHVHVAHMPASANFSPSYPLMCLCLKTNGWGPRPPLPPEARVVPVPRHVVLVSLCPRLASEFMSIGEITSFKQTSGRSEIHHLTKCIIKRSDFGHDHTLVLLTVVSFMSRSNQQGHFGFSRPCKVFGATWAENFWLGVSVSESLHVNRETVVRVNVKWDFWREVAVVNMNYYLHLHKEQVPL